MKSFFLFVAGGMLFGAMSLGIGYAVRGEEALVQGGSAFGLTFLPAAATLAWVLNSYRTTPEMQLLASLGGSGIRMAIALGGGFVLNSSAPEMFSQTLWFWLVLFYLGLLGFELILMVRQSSKLDAAPPA